jgi:hypothetical protein
VDAGWHEVVAQSARGTMWRATLKIHDGEQRQLAVPLSLVTVRSGAAGPVVSTATATPTVTASVAVQQAVTESSDPGTGQTRRIAGVALGAAGLAAVVVGGYFGLHASSLWADRNRQCPMERCTADGVRLGERADTSATVATWTIGAGLVTMGAAAWLWFSSPGRPVAGAPAISRLVPDVGLDGQGRLVVGGVF